MCASNSCDVDIEEGLRWLREGRPDARNKLIACASCRFRSLVSRILDDYKRLRRFEETGDIVNNTVIRLCETLLKVHPENTLHFCRLVSRQIRFQILDLIRHYFGPYGIGTNETGGLPREDEIGPRGATRSEDGPHTLAEWTEFHTKVGELPEAEREIVEMHWYQGLTIQQIAELLGEDWNVTRSRWRKARGLLGPLL